MMSSSGQKKLKGSNEPGGPGAEARGRRRVTRRRSVKGGLSAVGRWLLLLVAVFGLLPRAGAVAAQEIVDKMMAVINGRELVTYTDLMWQLALEPTTPLENPRAEDLNRALEIVINQRLVAQEAGKLPSIAPKSEDVEAELAKLIKRFPSNAEFYQRIGRVGLTAEQLREIVRQRVEIENYLNFRFRLFVLVTDQELADYYREVWAPRERRRAPGRIVPTLEEARDEIRNELTESKVESDTDAFLENARATAEIVYLSSV